MRSSRSLAAAVAVLAAATSFAEEWLGAGPLSREALQTDDKCISASDGAADGAAACALNALQTRATARSEAPRAHCVPGEDMICPGSPGGVHCAGNECCPGTADLGDFVCPSADTGWNNCTRGKRYDCLDGGGSPAPPAATPYFPHFDTSPDYLRIAARARGVSGHPGKLSDNYYLVVGDWGGCGYGCCCEMQRQVAEKMSRYVAERRKGNHDSTLMFVLAVGDNFYWNGANDSTFKTTWHDVYSREIREVPWFAVFGNHDYGNNDNSSGCPNASPRFTCDASNANTPACGGTRPYSTQAQGYSSNQLNVDKGGVGGSLRRNFHMPDYTYYYSIPELRFELLAMDWNWLAAFPGALGGNGINPGQGAGELAAHCGSDVALSAALRGIQDASTQILTERAAAAAAQNYAIIGHYPDWFQGGANFRDMFLGAVPVHSRSPFRKVFNFYGHTHVQNCSRALPGRDGTLECVNFLTGGAGGCCSASTDVPAGFVAISFSDTDAGQFVECFVDEPCALFKYANDDAAAPAAAAAAGGAAPAAAGSPSELESADVCANTVDHPDCPNYRGPPTQPCWQAGRDAAVPASAP